MHRHQRRELVRVLPSRIGDIRVVFIFTLAKGDRSRQTPHHFCGQMKTNEVSFFLSTTIGIQPLNTARSLGLS